MREVVEMVVAVVATDLDVVGLETVADLVVIHPVGVVILSSVVGGPVMAHVI